MARFCEVLILLWMYCTVSTQGIAVWLSRPGENKCYYFYDFAVLGVDTAITKCAEKGMKLPKFNSLTEQDNVLTELGPSIPLLHEWSGPWLGYRRKTGSTTEYETIDGGESVTEYNWIISQLPFGAGCVKALSAHDWQWMHTGCDDKYGQVLCQADELHLCPRPVLSWPVIVAASPLEYHNNDVANVQCAPGYEMTGSMTCNCLGEWMEGTDGFPQCTRIQCDPPDLLHGSVETTFAGETKNATCDIGFSLAGDATVECDLSGSWVIYADCERSECNPPNIPHGGVSGTTYAGDTKDATCDPGYVIGDVTTVECSLDGTWTIDVVCRHIPCSVPSTPHGSLAVSTPIFAGWSVRVKCDLGYATRSTSMAFCGLDGNWAVVPACERAQCPAIGIPHGVANVTYAGDVANVTCEVGYEATPNAQMQCKLAGVWEDIPSCTKACTELAFEPWRCKNKMYYLFVWLSPLIGLSAAIAAARKIRKHCEGTKMYDWFEHY